MYQHHPHVIQTTKTEQTPFEDLKSEHIQKINDDWSTPLERFRQYQSLNLSINMFFVDSTFTYSYAWCVGVQTVTTSNCKYLSTVDTNPFLEVYRISVGGNPFFRDSKKVHSFVECITGLSTSRVLTQHTIILCNLLTQHTICPIVCFSRLLQLV